MDSLKAHYRLLLGLDEKWSVTGVDVSLDEKQIMTALEFIGNTADCPDCGAACALKDHAPERQWRHLDTMQFETILKARTPRSNCKTCGVKTVQVPWAGPHSRFTLLFEAFVVEVLIAAQSVQAAGALVGLGWNSVHAIMQRAVDCGLAERSLDGIRYVGIDEKSFKRGQNYISVMTDPEGSRVLDVAPGRCAVEYALRGPTRRSRSGRDRHVAGVREQREKERAAGGDRLRQVPHREAAQRRDATGSSGRTQRTQAGRGTTV